MNLCFCCNTNYLMHLNTLMYSILETNRFNYFKFFVINKDIDLFDLNKSLHSSFYSKFKIIDCKISSKIDDVIENLPHQIYGKEIFYRLFIDDFIKEDKILYLDCDMIVRGDLKGLWECDLKDNIVGAVKDCIDGSYLGMPKEKPYFNSGLLLVDLIKWRGNDLKRKTINYILKNLQKLKYPDQDALNYCLMNKWVELDSSYNYQLNIKKNRYHYPSLTEKNEPIIIHFNGGLLNKPWLFESKVKFKSDYWKYRNKTMYRTIFADDFTLKDNLKRFLKNFFKTLLRIPFLKSFLKMFKEFLLKNFF